MNMKPLATNPNIHAARKNFHDWLDRTRPWAEPGCHVYQMMDQIVDAAAMYFRGDCRPTEKDMEALQTDLLNVTALLSEHPEGYDGLCACKKCRESC